MSDTSNNWYERYSPLINGVMSAVIAALTVTAGYFYFQGKTESVLESHGELLKNFEQTINGTQGLVALNARTITILENHDELLKNIDRTVNGPKGINELNTHIGYIQRDISGLPKLTDTVVELKSEVELVLPKAVNSEYAKTLSEFREQIANLNSRISNLQGRLEQSSLTNRVAQASTNKIALDASELSKSVSILASDLSARFKLDPNLENNDLIKNLIDVQTRANVLQKSADSINAAFSSGN